MTTRRRHSALAASFVVTVATLSGCEDKPKYAPNPPAPTTTATPASVDAGTAAADPPAGPIDPGFPPPNDAGRRIIANPPRLMDAPAGGFLEKRDDGCYWAETKPQPCPPGADCKPTPPMRRVLCPEPKK